MSTQKNFKELNFFKKVTIYLHKSNISSINLHNYQKSETRKKNQLGKTNKQQHQQQKQKQSKNYQKVATTKKVKKKKPNPFFRRIFYK